MTGDKNRLSREGEVTANTAARISLLGPFYSLNNDPGLLVHFEIQNNRVKVFKPRSAV